MNVSPVTTTAANPVASVARQYASQSHDMVATVDDAIEQQSDALEDGDIGADERAAMQQNLDMLDAFRERIQDSRQFVADLAVGRTPERPTGMPAPDAVAGTYAAWRP